MNRRHYLAGAGSVFGVGAAGGYAAGRSSQGDDEDDGGDRTDDDAEQPAEESDEEQEPGVRTLLHFTSEDVSDQERALNNAENLLADTTVDNDEVRFVANSHGIYAFVEDETDHADRVQSLAEEGIVFEVCENSLEGLGVDEDDLFPEVDVVPSSVGELAKRQAEGYGYIKVP
jgi:uncharacterized protein